MASAEQLKALLRSHLEGDNDRFISVAMQVAAHEAKLGHGKLATDLRTLSTRPRSGVARDPRSRSAVRAESWPTCSKPPTPRRGWGT